MKILILLLLVIFISINNTDAFFGGKKKEDKKEISAKDSLVLGIESLMKSSNDPNALLEIQGMLKDPEALAQVQKMMKDPEFQQEMERLKSNPVYANAMAQAADLYNNPTRAAEILEMKRQAETLNPEDELTDAELGFKELQKAAKNPKMLAEAMEMLKDPEIQKEVQAMMKDPDFQRQMKAYTDSPSFKKAAAYAAGEVDRIAQDPVKLKQFEQEMKF